MESAITKASRTRMVSFWWKNIDNPAFAIVVATMVNSIVRESNARIRLLGFEIDRNVFELNRQENAAENRFAVGRSG